MIKGKQLIFCRWHSLDKTYKVNYVYNDNILFYLKRHGFWASVLQWAVNFKLYSISEPYTIKMSKIGSLVNNTPG